MQLTWLLERQHQLQPTIATRGSDSRKLPSRRASNLPRVEDLVVARWSNVILIDDQMQVHNLFIDRFCLRPLKVQRANSQEQFTQARSTNRSTNQLTKIAHNCPTDLINDCSVKPKTIENGYAKEPIGKMIHISKQLRIIDQSSD